jgi:hypothetical protein
VKAKSAATTDEEVLAAVLDDYRSLSAFASYSSK